MPLHGPEEGGSRRGNENTPHQTLKYGDADNCQQNDVASAFPEVS